LLLDVDDPFEIIGRLRDAAEDPWFQRYAEATAMKMVTNVFSDAGRTWREAATVNSQGARLHRALQAELRSSSVGATVSAEVQRNAEYIRSVPANIARDFTEHISTRAFEGMRASDIAKELQALYPHVSDVKANLIARTETSKTHTALEQARSDYLGIKWYQWRTSEDARVRDSHRHMDRVLVAWDDPPSPELLVGERNVGAYHAGNIWNCRCAPLGIIDLDGIEWPAKVFQGGSITRMSRKNFERIWIPSLVF
jgi:SPP1 gp7 family putative phage head morphogenesis protein